MVTLDEAVEVFVTAFCGIKSRTHPYVARRVGTLWVMEDAPRKKPRVIEVVGRSVPADEVQATLRDAGIGRHFYCDIAPPEEDRFRRRDTFKACGYRALGTEWVFAHRLSDIPVVRSNPPVCLAMTSEDFDRVPQRSSHKRPWYGVGRQYTVSHPTRSIGFVRSVPCGQDAWVSDLFVHEAYRRQGYGTALMSRLLRDDGASGVRNSVLTASLTGSKLYPQLGYELIGIVQTFVSQSAGK